jgi:molybdopterin-dependent oxidoreductase alpha subunit
MVRLRMLRMNTMPALDVERLADVAALSGLDGRRLRELGRLPYPMVRRRGEPGFRRLPWDEALDLAADPIRRAEPDRVAVYTTSRGLTNEVYYVAQKLARLLGTNNVDNAARLCHAASTVALKRTLGVGASTCSYSDWMDTDLVVLLGSHLANNQPVATKYLHYAVERGARIAVINPYREPAMEAYWVPSVVRSALFGTRLMDAFFSVRVGGDIGFLQGVLKHLLATDRIDRDFIRDHTTGFEEMAAAVNACSWEELERSSGTTRAEMERFAELYGGVRRAVLIWSMGLTQHTFGVQNVEAVVNLALSRGMIGRQGCGVVPVRGHSGVQGAAEVGSVPNLYPGGHPVGPEGARALEELWSHPVPATEGLSAADMIQAAHAGRLDALYMMGGNFLETLPEPGYVRQALQRVGCRIHQDLVLNTSMLAEPADRVILLPAMTRYEQPGGGTSTSTERRIRFSPEVPGPRVGEARCEWQILVDLAQRVLPSDAAARIAYRDVREIMDEIERVVPLYRGISRLRREGDSVQYGGPRLLEGGVCPDLPGGRARFTALDLPPLEVPEGHLYLATRRGKQFNTIVWGDDDPTVGSRRRDEVFLSAQDAAAAGLRDGDPLVLRSKAGEFRGVVRIAPVHPGTLQAFWPEANVLLEGRLDPDSLEPDYNTLVRMERA